MPTRFVVCALGYGLLNLYFLLHSRMECAFFVSDATPFDPDFTPPAPYPKVLVPLKPSPRKNTYGTYENPAPTVLGSDTFKKLQAVQNAASFVNTAASDAHVRLSYPHAQESGGVNNPAFDASDSQKDASRLDALLTPNAPPHNYTELANPQKLIRSEFNRATNTQTVSFSPKPPPQSTLRDDSSVWYGGNVEGQSLLLDLNDTTNLTKSDGAVHLNNKGKHTISLLNGYLHVIMPMH